MVLETAGAAAQVNERPYERGALLVIPRAHRESILDISPEEISAVYRLARVVSRAAVSAFGAVGANIFQNNGVKGGQTEPHFHVHVVPRYPESDPSRRFFSRDFPVISLEEQRMIAAAVRAHVEVPGEA